MNPSDSPRPVLTEDDVDRLLTHFFEHEVPAEFKMVEPALPRAVMSSGSSGESGKSRTVAAVLTAGISCLIGVTLLVQPEDPRASALPATSMLPASSDDFASPHNITRDDTLEPRVPGVEDQSHLAPVGASDENSHPQGDIEVMIPELEVELFPTPTPGTR